MMELPDTTEWAESYGGWKYRINKMDSHRNGVSGNRFVVSLIDAVYEGTLYKFVTTSFPMSIYSDRPYPSTELQMREFASNTSALEVGELAGENIAFARGNSWNGADMFGMAIAEEYRARCLKDGCGMGSEFMYDPFEVDAEEGQEVEEY